MSTTTPLITVPNAINKAVAALDKELLNLLNSNKTIILNIERILSTSKADDNVTKLAATDIIAAMGDRGSQLTTLGAQLKALLNQASPGAFPDEVLAVPAPAAAVQPTAGPATPVTATGTPAT